MNKFEFKNLTPFKWFVLENFPFIEADFDALTEWQLFCKLGKEINKIINSENTLGTQVENVTNAFNNLKNYVDNYFDNLDVQDEINNKLNEMASDGTLEKIINQEIFGEINNKIQQNSNSIQENSNSIQENSNSINKLKIPIDKPLRSRPLLIAHKGSYLNAPENSIPAYEIASQLLYDCGECDVQMTLDKHFVLIHNETVDETTDGSGYVSNMTLQQIKNLNINKGANIEDYPNLKIPTLEEFLEFCSFSNLIPVIEIKNIPYEDIPSFFNIIKEKGFENKAIITSASTGRLQIIRKLSTKIILQAILDMTIDNINLCIENLFDIVVDYDNKPSNFEDLLKYAHKNGIKIQAWNIKGTNYLNQAVSFGVDYLSIENIFYYYNQDFPLLKLNGIIIYNKTELEMLEALGGLTNNNLKPLLLRGIDSSQNFPECINYFSKSTAVCPCKIIINPDSVVHFNIPDEYNFTIRCFYSNGTRLPDLGWFSGNSKTNFSENTGFGICYFSKKDSTDLNLKDLEKLRKIITYISKPNNYLFS